MALLPQIEKELMPFKVRAHWGKLFTLSPNVLSAHYEKLNDFRQLMKTYDPKGKLKNDFIKGTLGV